jgi:hypothetical protein
MVDELFQGWGGQAGTQNAIMASSDYISQAQRSFGNIEDGFYISPSFLDKLSIHIAKNFMNLPKIKVPLILGIWGGKGQVSRLAGGDKGGNSLVGQCQEAHLSADRLGSWFDMLVGLLQWCCVFGPGCCVKHRPTLHAPPACLFPSTIISQGKTFQCMLAFKKLGISPIVMSAGELESGNAGEPAKLLRQRYREASDSIKKVRGGRGSDACAHCITVAGYSFGVGIACVEGRYLVQSCTSIQAHVHSTLVLPDKHAVRCYPAPCSATAAGLVSQHMRCSLC